MGAVLHTTDLLIHGKYIVFYFIIEIKYYIFIALRECTQRLKKEENYENV